MQLELITTTFPKNKKKESRQWLAFAEDTGEENEVLNLYPDIGYQVFEGAGGAFTEASAYVFSLMDEKNRAKLLAAYFGPEGAGYTLGRVHLDSCDFSRNHYEAMSDPADRSLSSFSLARDAQHIIPLIHAAEKTLGKPIKLLAAPWSPPAFMKTTGERNNGGKLKDECRAFFADYCCKYLLELRKLGVHISRITVQNEPKASQTWDSCVYSSGEEKVFIRDFLSPAFKQNNLGDVEIFLWDHNKERAYERARDMLDPAFSPLVAGIAVHWYSGDHFEAIRLLGEQFPDKKLVQSEFAILMADSKTSAFLDPAEKYAHDIIGNLNAGLSAFYDWNLVLDEAGGPNHVQNYCEAPFFYHTGTGVLEERCIFPYIAHFSRYIRPGARRIAFSTYTSDLEATAFQNTNGNLAVVLLNRTDGNLPVNIRLGGKLTGLLLPPRSISTGVISV
jgi:glucosylceramidase